MDIVIDNPRQCDPKVSIVLLDWSCRESFHLLTYLNEQTADRGQYEIIWIEYYGRRAVQIDQELKKAACSGRPHPTDQWLIMNTPTDVYYHKHLMYNVGLVRSRGEIIVFCDSDAIVKNTFVETIIRSFEEDPSIVLHLDQVRNNDRRFYPFNYPSLEDVIGSGAINWSDGKTTGLWDSEDTLHSRNYGACLAARRNDLIMIGGADEHIDYLGHICGPYDMTFRLINYGKREVWHPNEFLYHVWHPGQAGDNNYLGPHDGRHMSTTALDVRRTGRVLPLIENPAVRLMRVGAKHFEQELLTSLVVCDHTYKGWSASDLGQTKTNRAKWLLDGHRRRVLPNAKYLRAKLLIAKLLFKLLARQFYKKARKVSREASTFNYALRKARNSYRFLRDMAAYNVYLIQRIQSDLDELIAKGTDEISIYGAGDIAELIYELSLQLALKVRAIYDDDPGAKSQRIPVLPVKSICNSDEKIVIATLTGVDEKVERLQRLGVRKDRLLALRC